MTAFACPEDTVSSKGHPAEDCVQRVADPCRQPSRFHFSGPSVHIQSVGLDLPPQRSLDGPLYQRASKVRRQALLLKAFLPRPSLLLRDDGSSATAVGGDTMPRKTSTVVEMAKVILLRVEAPGLPMSPPNVLAGCSRRLKSRLLYPATVATTSVSIVTPRTTYI